MLAVAILHQNKKVPSCAVCVNYDTKFDQWPSSPSGLADSDEHYRLRKLKPQGGWENQNMFTFRNR